MGLGAAGGAGGFSVVDAKERAFALLVVLDDVLVFGGEDGEFAARGNGEVAISLEVRTDEGGGVACFEGDTAFAA